MESLKWLLLNIPGQMAVILGMPSRLLIKPESAGPELLTAATDALMIPRSAPAQYGRRI